MVGVPLAVVYKYFDDQGNYLAAALTYYAFIAIFPLLLLSSSILGFVLQGDPRLEERVLDSALSQFPIVGDQLGRPDGLQGSTAAIVVGGLAALYGSLGLGQSLQNAMNVAWSVPRNSRPNPVLLRLKSLLLLITAGVAVLSLTVFSALSAATDLLDDRLDGTARLLVQLGALLALAAMLTVFFRFAAARQHPWVAAVPGALTVAVLWQALQYLGALYATRVIAATTDVNGTFALVLGLIGIIYLAAAMAVLGMEVNVVLARRLWPRALLTPFTDAVELTDADRRAYALYARAQRHKGFETVTVSFDERARARPPAGPSEEPAQEPSR
nr:YihY/virulence factor BrkB family protein [Nocardioides perillae]